ncbi:hypothetical protein CBL_12367 [Carabus blaptoides fortunei]
MNPSSMRGGRKFYAGATLDAATGRCETLPALTELRTIYSPDRERHLDLQTVFNRTVSKCPRLGWPYLSWLRLLSSSVREQPKASNRVFLAGIQHRAEAWSLLTGICQVFMYNNVDMCL